MAVILRTTHQYQSGTSDSENNNPILYVDSINRDSYISEMHNMCVQYIRAKSINTIEFISINDDVSRNERIAKDESDVYYNKKDGYYYTINEDTRVFVMYNKNTYPGYIMDTITVEKLFTLTCVECKRIVPQVFKKNTVFEDFTAELKTKVMDYRDRTLIRK